MRFTVEERVFIVEKYFNTHSYVQCRLDFTEKFGKETPVKSAIQKLLKRFRETGSVLDKTRDRQKTVLTTEVVQDIDATLTRSPHKSLRRLGQEKNVSVGSAHAVRKMLKLYPYRMQVVHELNPSDYERTVAYCKWFL
jgi:transposase